MPRTFVSFVKWGSVVTLCVCLAVVGIVFFVGERHVRELKTRLRDIRSGNSWRSHLEWFREQENIEGVLRKEILSHWRDNPEYASSVADLARSVAKPSQWATWTEFFGALAKEHLNMDWKQVAKQGEMVDFVMRCMLRMEYDEESHSLLLDYVERHPSDLLKRAAIVQILRWRREGVAREREVFAQAAESDNTPPSGKALEAMAQLRYRECIAPARHILGRPEAKHRLRTVAAAALVMLGDHTSYGAVKAYVAELKSSFVESGESAELGDPTSARFWLEKLTEAFLDAPVPAVWVEEMEKFAGFKCAYLRKSMAEQLSQTPDRAFMGVAKMLLKDGDAEVRAKAKDAVSAIKDSMPETWDSLKEEPARDG